MNPQTHVILSILLLSGAVGSVQSQVLDLQPTCMVDGGSVRLRDIAQPSGDLPTLWGDRVIAESPAPGISRSLRLADIATALHAYPDMHSIVLRGQTEIKITARAQALDFEALDRALADYMLGRPEWAGRRFRVTRDGMPPLKTVSGVLDVDIQSLTPSPSTGDMTAQMRLTINGQSISEDGGATTVPLTELRPYWASVRPILRGAVVSAADVEEHWVAIDDGRRFYPAADSIIGMEARRNLQSGQLFAMGSLAAPVYAKRGEIVRVTSRQGGLTITLRARALSDGRRADRIACVNERSGRRMYVRLVSMREAVLDDMEEVGS
ncbi:MAG TPA: flagella basal body P-ring formation protein FlgA [Verrucomicrobia bacterium]|nr:flagella basal body P-ring formation protein FlgA [Verrucomicrobiota bacterium]